MWVVAVVVLGLFLCGLVAGSMAENRGNAFLPYFAFGCLLGVVGIFLAAVARTPQPKQRSIVAASSTQPREPRTRAERRIAERFSRNEGSG